MIVAFIGIFFVSLCLASLSGIIKRPQILFAFLSFLLPVDFVVKVLLFVAIASFLMYFSTSKKVRP